MSCRVFWSACALACFLTSPAHAEDAPAPPAPPSAPERLEPVPPPPSAAFPTATESGSTTPVAPTAPGTGQPTTNDPAAKQPNDAPTTTETHTANEEQSSEASTKPKLVYAGSPARIDEPPKAPYNRKVPTASYVLGGIGLIGVGMFVGFGLTAVAEENELRAKCAPYCAKSEVDRVYKKQLIADISLGVGLSALFGAVWLLVERPAAEPSYMSVNVSPTPGGGTTSFEGVF